MDVNTKRIVIVVSLKTYLDQKFVEKYDVRLILYRIDVVFINILNPVRQ